MSEATQKQALLVLLVALAALVFQAAFANAAATLIGGTLTVSGIKYTPSPAEPGRYIDVFVSLDNGAYPINNVECKIDSTYPFSVDDPKEEAKSIAYLPIGQGAVLKYRVRVATDAVTGYNDMLFSCRSQGVDWVQAKMQVYVKVQEAVVSISQVKLNPTEIKPGETAVLTAKLANAGNSPVKDISLKLVFSSDTPFATVGSSSEKRVALLEPKASDEVSFELLAFPNAEVKAYRLPLELNYYDDAGNKRTRNDSIGVVVASKPELSVELDSSKLYTANTTGEVIIRVVNKGIADAKFLEVAALESPDYEIISGQKTYVGALDSDDYQTIELKLYANTVSPSKTLRIPVALSFKDANNNAYTEKNEVAVPLYSQAELEKYGFAAPQGIMLSVAALIVLAIAAYFVYTRVLKKKK